MTRKIDIPRGAIRHLVGTLHVGNPDDFVRSMIRERIEHSPERAAWKASDIRRAEEFALRCHHETQALYAAVMTGRF